MIQEHAFKKLKYLPTAEYAAEFPEMGKIRKVVSALHVVIRVGDIDAGFEQTNRTAWEGLVPMLGPRTSTMFIADGNVVEVADSTIAEFIMDQRVVESDTDVENMAGYAEIKAIVDGWVDELS